MAAPLHISISGSSATRTVEPPRKRLHRIRPQRAPTMRERASGRVSPASPRRRHRALRKIETDRIYFVV